MTLSRIGRFGMAFVVSVAMGLGMTACGGRTIGYMWVLGTQASSAAGQQSGQVVGYKIDNFTGNLTTSVNSPYSSGGVNPVSIVVKGGGRFVYVVNQGVPTANPTSCTADVQGSIEIFSVGGDGTLTQQSNTTSQGCTPVWAATDSTGTYLYVLDKLSPAYGTVTNGVTDHNGSITAFAIAPDTGRLTLITNAQVKNPTTGTQLNYFEVGPSPIMMNVATGGCLYTVDQGDSTIYPYTLATGGQLQLTTNSTVQVGAGSQLTSIISNGNNLYLTDAANNLILPYKIGSGCALNTLTGGAFQNLAGTSNPSFSFVDGKGQYLYVLNQNSNNSNVPNSSITALFIDPSTSKLSLVAGGTDTNDPYPVGAGPVCMGEDPTNQYVYISNSISGTVTGKQINTRTGQLTALARGETFPATGHASCLAISPNVQ